MSMWIWTLVYSVIYGKKVYGMDIFELKEKKKADEPLSAFICLSYRTNATENRNFSFTKRIICPDGRHFKVILHVVYSTSVSNITTMIILILFLHVNKNFLAIRIILTLLLSTPTMLQ